MGTHTNCFSLKQHRNLTFPASARTTLWDLTSTVWEYHYIQLPSMHTAATLYFLENGYTLVPCLAILLMKACPSRAVFAHSKKAPVIVKVFADGYSLFKVQQEEILFPFHLIGMESPFCKPISGKKVEKIFLT